MRKRSDPNRATWVEQLKVLEDDVAAMPPGPQRDAAANRAQQLKAAIEMDGWLRSGELKAPE